MAKKKPESPSTDIYSIRFNAELNQYHYCLTSEVNQNATGWETIGSASSEKEAEKLIKEKKGE